MRALSGALAKEPEPHAVARVFVDAIDALERSIRYVVSNYRDDFRGVAVGAVPLLKLFGVVAGGWQLLRSATIAQARLAAPDSASLPAAFYRSKIETARFFAHHVLSQAAGLAHAIEHGAEGALAEGVL